VSHQKQQIPGASAISLCDRSRSFPRRLLFAFRDFFVAGVSFCADNGGEYSKKMEESANTLRFCKPDVL
jgi:hypothetical protein